MSSFNSENTRRKSSRVKNPAKDTPLILSASYLESSNKKDLVQRLLKVVNELEQVVNELGEDELDTVDHPGLESLASALVEDRFLVHRDKDVRLHSSLACMLIFALYAPEPPYDERQTLKIFDQVIRQLASLIACTSPSQPNYTHYFRLLKDLSEVKIGTVLVEMTNTLCKESSEDYDGTSPTSEDALEKLTELIHTLLHCVHQDHPPELSAHAISAICACVEEFEVTIPYSILDEILLCIGTGPVVMVTNPDFVKMSAALANRNGRRSSGDKKKMPPMHIKQTNQSYYVAKEVIQMTEDKGISTPIANLLKGLLEGDSKVMEQTNIPSTEIAKTAQDESTVGTKLMPSPKATFATVWSIIYELHTISPQILTTVIGTVASYLETPDKDKRLRVTRVLGRLFYSRTSNIAVKFRPCYRVWIRRSSDVDVNVRLKMVKYLLEILRNKSNEPDLCQEASDALVKMITSDPTLDVRLECIREVCQLAHDQKSNNFFGVGSGSSCKSQVGATYIPSTLLKAVGNRVSSKNKGERRDSVTGLAKIYYKQFLWEQLKDVQRGGDDCDIGIIIKIIKDTCDFENDSRELKRSPKVKKKGLLSPISACTEKEELRAKYKFIPSLVFESACFTDTIDPAMRNRVIMIIDDILLGADSSTAKSGILTPTSRATGFAMIIKDVKNSPRSPETSSKSNAFNWMCSLFTQRAQLQLALRAYIDARTTTEEMEKGSKKQKESNTVAFRKLQNVASLLSFSDRVTKTASEDLNEILRKVHTARDRHIFKLLSSISIPTHSSSARVRALKELPKRTKSLGSSVESWIKNLTMRSAMGNFVNGETISHCILLAQEAFNENEFEVSAMLLDSVKTVVHIYPALGGSKEGFETLVELLNGSLESSSPEIKKEIKQTHIVTMLTEILSAVTRSQHGIKEKGYMQISTLKADLIGICTNSGTAEQIKNAINILSALVKVDSMSDPEQFVNDCKNVFQPLLKKLTSSSRMKLILNDGGDNEKVIDTFNALTPMADCAPFLFLQNNADFGSKAVAFAKSILLEHDNDSIDKTSRGGKDLEEDKSKDSPKRKRKRLSRQREPSVSILSLSCQRICCAIEFLVTHIRSTIVFSRNKSRLVSAPSDQHLRDIFDVLVDLLQSGGLPRSNQDRSCNEPEERAALRECASLNLFRLCDSFLKLERIYLSTRMYHILSRSFLDKELSVREAVMDELSLMLKGESRYRHGSSASAPSLRFLAFISLCPDSNQYFSESNDSSDRHTIAAKTAARQCVCSLRRTCDATLFQCKTISQAAEQNFEKNLKMMLMPEYSVPYAFHLLAFRPETPCVGNVLLNSIKQGTGETSLTIDDEEHNILKKRLKWLFQPLITSLGDSPENISFLLRQTEVLGHKYRPRTSDVMNPSTKGIEDEDICMAKLKVVCSSARQVLLQFAKKDVKLPRYPGVIHIPSNLFKIHSNSPGIDVVNIPVVSQPEKIDNEDTIGGSKSPDSKMNNSVDTKSSTSPKVLHSGSQDHSHGDKSHHNDLNINLSPIPQSRSPMSSQSAEEKIDHDKGHGRTKRPRDTIISPGSIITETSLTGEISKLSPADSGLSKASKRSRKTFSPSDESDSGKTSSTHSSGLEAGGAKRKSSMKDKEASPPNIKSSRRRSRRLRK